MKDAASDEMIFDVVFFETYWFGKLNTNRKKFRSKTLQNVRPPMPKEN